MANRSLTVAAQFGSVRYRTMTVRDWFRVFWLSVSVLAASEHHGQVTFGGLPLPGATVTALPAGGDEQRNLSTITDQQGMYSFPDLADGVWTIRIEMQCFAPAEGAPGPVWELKLLPLQEMKASSAPPAAFQKTEVNAAKSAPAPARTDTTASNIETAAELNQRAADGFLINGSTNNSASSLFSLAAAFGNARKGSGSLYNGNIGLIVDNSALDARAFSFTGQDTPQPAYNHLTAVLAFGGPLKIPHLLRNGPNFFLNYQWTRNLNADTQPGRMPTEAERNGDFSQSATRIFDPNTGSPFANNRIPQDRISRQAKALLNLYPLPNFDANARYNYQVALVGVTHQDSLQTRFNKTISRKDQLSGTFAYQSTRADSTNLFGFLDTTDTAGINTSVNWRHNLTTRLSFNLGYQFSRLATRITPFFENRVNISGLAGISGNNQDPLNWGPPNLIFSSGVAGLSDAGQSFTRNQTSALSLAAFWNRGRHNLYMGGDLRRQQFNLLSQQDARGTFTFTGASGTGSDFAGFLLGIPDTSAIAFGNAGKYLRAWANDAYITDDWRISPGLTVNAGVRWEYGSPITELYGRLVNLDLAPGFSAEVPVVARNPLGSLTGQNYPDSLVYPDKHGFQPRVAVSWRPFSASSTIVRAGYGLYYNSSVYQSIATQMAQQSPLSKSLSVQNSPADPLTLANGFNVSPGITPNTFAIDPYFRVGYAHNWQLSVQRDLPGALVMTATYLGVKGTRGVQMFLPNTYPNGAVNLCPTCPRGFAYLTSNGNSTRESGQIQLRRRLHSGFTGSLQYTLSKSIDDAALGGRGQGGSVIAQDWLDLRAERGLSNFDQRHALSLQLQYTTGMGIGGGALAGGRIAALLKEWTVTTQITAGSGFPLTPIYLAAVNGTGVTGSIRPDYTGAPLYDAPPGLFLNPSAYAAPAPGRWGNAGRDSIVGPAQFSFNASLGRTFRVADRVSLDLRVDSVNALNSVTFINWNTTVTSSQFGLPAAANAMRSVQTTLRARF
ncbi:MAG: TonB-dependent receptor [Bryobacteraceae bacterium]